MVRVIRSHNVEADFRILADQLVVEFPGIRVVLAVGFEADLWIAQNVSKENFGKKLYDLPVLDLGVLDFDLDVLLGVGQELVESAVS